MGLTINERHKRRINPRGRVFPPPSDAHNQCLATRSECLFRSIMLRFRIITPYAVDPRHKTRRAACFPACGTSGSPGWLIVPDKLVGRHPCHTCFSSSQAGRGRSLTTLASIWSVQRRAYRSGGLMCALGAQDKNAPTGSAEGFDGRAVVTDRAPTYCRTPSTDNVTSAVVAAGPRS